MTWIEVRHDLDCGEVWISGPGLVWQGWRWDANICNLDGAWMEVTQESWDLNAGDTGSGWRWDTNLGTWIALRWDLEGAEIQSTRPAWRWDVILMELRRESYGLDWAEMRDEWRWDEHLETWMFIYDAWMELGCNFGTWVEVRHTSWNLHGFEMVLGWSWDAILWTWMEIRHHRNGGETQMWGPALSWDMVWMERC